MKNAPGAAPDSKRSLRRDEKQGRAFEGSRTVRVFSQDGYLSQDNSIPYLMLGRSGVWWTRPTPRQCVNTEEIWSVLGCCRLRTNAVKPGSATAAQP